MFINAPAASNGKIIVMAGPVFDKILNFIPQGGKSFTAWFACQAYNGAFYYTLNGGSNNVGVITTMKPDYSSNLFATLSNLANTNSSMVDSNSPSTFAFDGSTYSLSSISDPSVPGLIGSIGFLYFDLKVPDPISENEYSFLSDVFPLNFTIESPCTFGTSSFNY